MAIIRGGKSHGTFEEWWRRFNVDFETEQAVDFDEPVDRGYSILRLIRYRFPERVLMIDDKPFTYGGSWNLVAWVKYTASGQEGPIWKEIK